MNIPSIKAHRISNPPPKKKTITIIHRIIKFTLKHNNLIANKSKAEAVRESTFNIMAEADPRSNNFLFQFSYSEFYQIIPA